MFDRLMFAHPRGAPTSWFLGIGALRATDAARDALLISAWHAKAEAKENRGVTISCVRSSWRGLIRLGEAGPPWPHRSECSAVLADKCLSCQHLGLHCLTQRPAGRRQCP